MPDTPIARSVGDPTPRALEQMYREIKSLEDKIDLRFHASSEAVKLLQDQADREPTTEAVNENLRALKELTGSQFEGLKDLTNAKFEGNKTALDAALKTQKEASDKIETNFAKQFDNLSKNIDDLKDRINRNDGRSKGLGDFIGWIVAAVVIVGGSVALIAKLPS